MRWVMDLRKFKVINHDFDCGEQNEKGFDVVVGIDVVLVMVLHPPQGVAMIRIMPKYFSTEHHGNTMRRISALQLLELKTLVYGKFMSVSRPIETHVEFLPCAIGDSIRLEGWHCVPCCPDVVYEDPFKYTWIVDLHTMQLLLNLRLVGTSTKTFLQTLSPKSRQFDDDPFRLPSQVSLCTRMEEIMSRIFSRIRDER